MVVNAPRKDSFFFLKKKVLVHGCICIEVFKYRIGSTFPSIDQKYFQTIWKTCSIYFLLDFRYENQSRIGKKKWRSTEEKKYTSKQIFFFFWFSFSTCIQNKGLMLWLSQPLFFKSSFHCVLHVYNMYATDIREKKPVLPLFLFQIQ